jgi:hypothetical protein
MKMVRPWEIRERAYVVGGERLALLIHRCVARVCDSKRKPNAGTVVSEPASQ